MTDEPLPEVNEINQRGCILIENFNKIHDAINSINSMEHSNDHDEFGISAHEKTHEVEALKRILKRITDGLAIEIPVPAKTQEIKPGA